MKEFIPAGLLAVYLAFGGKQSIKKNPAGTSRHRLMVNGPLKLKVYAVVKIKDWTWYITKKIPKKASRLEGLVVTPYVPEGEFGSFWYSDIEDGKWIDPFEAAPAPGYEWKN